MPSRLSPQWLCGNSCTWAHDGHTLLVPMNERVLNNLSKEHNIGGHRQAAQHLDECFIRKQSESFLSQPEQTIWNPRHRTLRTQYSQLGVFLSKQYKILACKVTGEMPIDWSFFLGV